MKLWGQTILSIWLLALGLASIILYLYGRTKISLAEDQFPRIPILILGFALVGVGVITYRKLKSPANGILINPIWVTYFYDFMNLLFGTLGGYLFLNVMLSKLGYNPPIVNDDYSLFMGTFYYIIGIPFVAFYTCRLTGQSIEITNDAVSVHGMFGSDKLEWSLIESVKVSDEYIGVGRVGVIIPKKLQKRLKLESNLAGNILINEPQLKSVKQKIIKQFLENTPPEKFEMVEKTLNSW